MRVRALDANNDWTFGAGLNNYKSGNLCIAQNIQTRLNCFQGTCFFDLTAGIDWINKLPQKNSLPLNINISNTIINTTGVLSLLQISFNISTARSLSVSYQVQTIYSAVTDTFTFSQTQG